MTKILGVNAGCGNLASNFFINRIIQLTPAEKEWDYFRIIADYNPFIPSRTRALLYGEESPASELVRTIEGLKESGANVVAVPCNSAHGWYNEVSQFIKVPWLNMIEITANAVKQQKVENVIVIGAYVTVKKRLYDKYLDNTIYLKKHEYKRLFKLIEQLKLSYSHMGIKKKLFHLLEEYRNNADGVLIACTEPSMLFGADETEWNGFKIVDSTNEYAKKCVSICKGTKP